MKAKMTTIIAVIVVALLVFIGFGLYKVTGLKSIQITTLKAIKAQIRYLFLTNTNSISLNQAA